MGTIIAVCLIVLLCFLAGLFARTLMAQKFTSKLESAMLSKVPAYDYLKQAGSSMMGLGEMAEHPVVLAQLGGAWRLGVQTDIVHGGLAAVFIPNSPNTFSGSVFFVARDRVQQLDVPLARALRSGAVRRRRRFPPRRFVLCGGRSVTVSSGLSRRDLANAQ